MAPSNSPTRGEKERNIKKRAADWVLRHVFVLIAPILLQILNEIAPIL